MDAVRTAGEGERIGVGIDDRPLRVRLRDPDRRRRRIVRRHCGTTTLGTRVSVLGDEGGVEGALRALVQGGVEGVPENDGARADVADGATRTRRSGPPQRTPDDAYALALTFAQRVAPRPSDDDPFQRLRGAYGGGWFPGPGDWMA